MTISLFISISFLLHLLSNMINHSIKIFFLNIIIILFFLFFCDLILRFFFFRYLTIVHIVCFIITHLIFFILIFIQDLFLLCIISILRNRHVLIFINNFTLNIILILIIIILPRFLSFLKYNSCIFLMLLERSCCCNFSCFCISFLLSFFHKLFPSFPSLF